MQEFNYPSAREIVSDFLRRRGQGEDISVDDVLAKYDQLKEELIREFAKLNLIASAIKNHSPDETNTKPTSEESTATSGPIVRCPSCGEPTDATLEESIKTVGCKGCGEIFSLVRDLNWPEQIDHFKLIERLGMGSFGAVWKAHDEELKRFVALKLPRRSFMDESEATMFVREAQTAAALSHPNIVTVHEVGSYGGSIYIASELIDGESLAQRCQNGIPIRQAVKLTEKIGRALHFAHENGIVHRDLKPQNVLLDKEGVPYLTDFGLASSQSNAQTPTVTMSGEVLGTIGYMCPEQARGDSHAADARSDVYSLGALLYQLLTGNVPFQGNQVAVLRRIQTEDPTQPRKLNHRVSLDLDTICMKCLEKEPDNRYQSAEAVADELGRVIRGEPILARPVGMVSKTIRWAKRNPVSAAYAVSALLAFLATVFAGNHMWRLSKTNETNRRINEANQLVIEADQKVNLANRRISILSQVRQLRADRQVGFRDKVAELISDNLEWLDDETKQILRNEYVLCLGDSTGFLAKEINLVDESTAIRKVAVSADAENLAIAFRDHDKRYRIEIRSVQDLQAKSPDLKVEGVFRELSFSECLNGDLLVIDKLGKLTQVSKVDQKIVATTSLRVDVPQLVEESAIDNAKFSANGNHLLLLWNNGGLQLYDVKRKASSILPPPTPKLPTIAKLKCFDLSTDAQHIVAGYSDPIGIATGIVYWNLIVDKNEPPVVKPIPMGTVESNAIAISHDSKWIGFGGEPTVLLDLSTLQERTSFVDTEVYSVAFCPKTNYLAINYITGIVEIINHKTRAFVGEIAQSKRDGHSNVTFSQDGQELITWNEGGLRFVRLGGNSERDLRDVHSRGVPSVAFTPDGSQFVSASKDKTVRFWNSEKLEEERDATIKLQGQAQSVAVGQNLFAVAEWRVDPEDKETISVWKTDQKDRPIHRLAHDLETVCGLGISPNEQYLAASGHKGITIWEIKKTFGKYEFEKLWTRTRAEVPEYEQDRFLTFDRSGKYLAHANKWGTDVRLVDLSKQPFLTTRLGGDSEGSDMFLGWHGLAFTPQNQLVLVGPDRALEYWSTTNGIKKLNSTVNNLFADSQIAVSEDGLLAGVTGARSVSILDVNTGELLYTLPPEVSAIYSLAWNPDPQKCQLLVGRSDGGISIWNVAEVQNALKLFEPE